MSQHDRNTLAFIHTVVYALKQKSLNGRPSSDAGSIFRIFKKAETSINKGHLPHTVPYNINPKKAEVRIRCRTDPSSQNRFHNDYVRAWILTVHDCFHPGEGKIKKYIRNDYYKRRYIRLEKK